MEKIICLLQTYNRLFFKNKLLIAFSIIFPIIFFIFFSMLFTNYDDVNRIPIALIDEDLSTLSQEVSDSIIENNALKVMSTLKNEAIQLLNRNKIEAIFVIKQGFETNLKTSKYDNSVEIIYLDKSTIGPALGDIVASNLMTPLAIYKAANTASMYGKQYDYNQMFEKTVILGQKFVSESRFEMSVEAQVKTPKSHLIEDLDITKLLKINITFGFTLVVFSMVILFMNSYFLDKDHLNVLKRLLSLGYKSSDLYFAEVFSIISCGTIIVFTELLLIVFGLKVYNPFEIFIVWITLMIHLSIVANVIIIATGIIRDKIKYQSLIAPLIFILGLLGGAFWSVEYLSKSFKWLSYLSPFYWALQILNKVILGLTIQDIFAPITIYLLILASISSLAYLLYHQFIKHIYTAK